MNLKTLAISILVVSMIILSGTTYLSSLASNYGAEVDLTGLNKTTERLEAQQDIASEINRTIMGMELKEPLTGALLIPYTMIRTGWNVMKLIGNSIWTIESIFSDLTRVSSESGIPIPAWVVPTIISIIIIVIFIIIVEAFIRWRVS